jgi:hypothetical protein
MVRTLRYLTAVVFFVALLFIPGTDDGIGRGRTVAAMGTTGGVDIAARLARPRSNRSGTPGRDVWGARPGSAVTMRARAADAGAALETPPAASPTPILIIASPANPFTRYYAEILRAEGLNGFAVVDISGVTDLLLDTYDVAILGDAPVSLAQQSMLSNWVDRGGNLIAMRPDKQLYPLFGLGATTSTLSNAYLLFDRTTRPASGLVGDSIPRRCRPGDAGRRLDAGHGVLECHDLGRRAGGDGQECRRPWRPRGSLSLRSRQVRGLHAAGESGVVRTGSGCGGAGSQR